MKAIDLLTSLDAILSWTPPPGIRHVIEIPGRLPGLIRIRLEDTITSGGKTLEIGTEETPQAIGKELEAASRDLIEQFRKRCPGRGNSEHAQSIRYDHCRRRRPFTGRVRSRS